MAEPSQQLALIPHTYQGDVISQRASDGYINATAMCRIAGKEWSEYRRLKSTKDFIPALARDLNTPESALTITTFGSPGGDPRNQGTWVHPQVAIDLASYLSSDFKIKVTRWVMDWMSGLKPTDKAWRQYEDRISLTFDAAPAGYFGIFKESADIYGAMIKGGVNFGTRMLLDISVGQHWSKYWKDNGLEAKYGASGTYAHNYPSYFPQSLSNPQSACCYPDDALSAFRRWMREVYMIEKLPTYLQSQVKQGKLSAPVASNAIGALVAHESSRARIKKV